MDRLAGVGFLLRLQSSLIQLYALADAVERLRTLLRDCSEGLTRAQELMREAESVAHDGGLVIRNHRIIPPSRDPRPLGPPQQEDMKHLYDERIIWEIYEEKYRTYDAAGDHVERACQILVDLCIRLGKAEESDWSAPICTGISLGLDTAKISAATEQEALLKASEEALRNERLQAWNKKYWGERALRSGKWSPVDEAIARRIGYEDLANTLDASARRLGGIVRLASKLGPIVTFAEVLYSLDKGTPADKAILTAGVGAAAGATAGTATTAAVGIFLAPPAGLIAGAVTGALAGYFASDAAGSYYDQNIESAREKLARWMREGMDDAPQGIGQREDKER